MDKHDHGLSHDLETLIKTTTDRRQVLRWLAMGAAAPLSYASGVCSIIPQETGGPYPGDGTNTVNGALVNVLALSGIIRSDIRASFAGATGIAAGIPLTIKLNLVNTTCDPLAGYAIYIWHCDRGGNYSLYSSGVTGENYLRGVQETDSNGQVTFTTIVPGCYSGRIPHVHLEVYPTLAKATSAASAVKTSQFTFPLDMLNATYATTGYTQSVSNLAQISYATDNVFSDGYALQMPSITGSTAAGYTATLQIAIDPTATQTTTSTTGNPGTPTGTPPTGNPGMPPGSGNFAVTATAAGATSSLTLTSVLTVAPPDVGTQGAIYVAARVGNALYFNNGSQWVLFSGTYPAYYSGTLAATQTINILSGLNVTGLCGAPIYVGYGANAQDMLGKNQYRTVHTLCQG